jgi:exodeoxyribonuclease VII small subunit
MSPRSKSKTKTLAADELSFEQAFEELEQIVRRLEEGQLSLDDSLALFERGQSLAARCGALLETAELKIKKLIPHSLGEDFEDFEDDPT